MVADLVAGKVIKIASNERLPGGPQAVEDGKRTGSPSAATVSR